MSISGTMQLMVGAAASAGAAAHLQDLSSPATEEQRQQQAQAMTETETETRILFCVSTAAKQLGRLLAITTKDTHCVQWQACAGLRGAASSCLKSAAELAGFNVGLDHCKTTDKMLSFGQHLHDKTLLFLV
jgi:hypothetical protein